MDEPQTIGEWIRISVLGSGGFGTVILWRNPNNDECIAIKKCKFQCPSSLSSKQKLRWCIEVQIMRELNHSNIVKYKPLPLILEQELNKHNPTKLPLLSMEYCSKGNLRHVLTQPTNLSGLKERSVKNVLLDISSAISYLHGKKITHRDIKPENIVLHECSERPEDIIYKLIDLGYAKELGDTTVSFVGTLYYIAPEILVNKKYDCSVDYWSLGVTAFEIICGVLPFCTNLSPTERFAMIKNKSENDICFYKSKMGNYLYSDQLFKENHITSSLKSDIELWLRKVLQFKPELRSLPFSNSLNVFDQLRNILEKKRLTVFCVYKYEFFSYEFDELTKLSTVKEWLAKDTQIDEKDQLFFSPRRVSEDHNLLIDILSEENNNILFTFKCSNSFNIDRPKRFPRMVKLMFEKPTENFKWKDVKSIYTHSIYYISNDLLHIKSLSEAIRLFLKNIRSEIEKLRKIKFDTTTILFEYIENLEIFSNILDKNMFSDVFRIDSIQQFAKISNKYFEVFNSYNYLENKWSFKIDMMDKMYSNMKNDIFKTEKLEELFKDAVHLLQSTADKYDRNSANMNVGAMARIVSKAVKFKDELFGNDNLRNFIEYLSFAKTFLEKLFLWILTYADELKILMNYMKSMTEQMQILKSEHNEFKIVDVNSESNSSEAFVQLSVRDRELMIKQYQEVCDKFLNFMEEMKNNLQSSHQFSVSVSHEN